MAAIASGLNFSTLNKEGVNLAICNTINTTTNPEYPALPFALGDVTEGLDGSSWIYAKPAANYAIGTVGYFDTSWNFTALPTGSLSSQSGLKVGVMSQVASVTASPSSTNYDGVWVQVAGLCPAIQVAASTSANAQLYNMASTTTGQLTSTSGSNSAINGIILTTAQGGGGAGTQVGLLNFPEIILTT
jgi:hypothetical protein